MTKSTTLGLGLLLASLTLLGGCNYHSDKAAKSNAAGAAQKPEIATLDFQTVYAQVISPKCVGCHDGAGESDLRSYALVKSALADIRDRVTRTDNKRMPKRNSLSEEQLNLLLAWIDAGGPETVAQPAPAPAPAPSASPEPQPQPQPEPQPVPVPPPASTPTPVPPSAPTPEILPTYASINEQIFKPRACLKCHTDGDDGEEHYDMNSLATILRDDADAITRKDSASSILIRSVTRTDNKRMPRGNRPPLPPEEVEVLKRWIELGSPP